MGETTLLDIQSDYIFKLLFGAEKNKKLLISLINSILKGNPEVKDLELRNSEMSKILKNNRTIHLDIKAEIGFQKFINIEVQVQNTGEIMDRAVQHLAEMLTRNSRKLTKEEKKAGKKRTYKYPKVIGIWIMGENVTDRENAVNEATVAFPPTEREDYQIITDKMRIFFVELPKFHPKHIDRKNMLDVWMAFLNNPLYKEIQDVTEVKQALEALQEISEDETTREIYYLRQQTELGYESAKNVAIEQAVKKTQKEERAKAEKEKKQLEEKALQEKKQLEEKALKEKIESAKSLIKAGVSAEVVANSLGLSPEEIQKL